MSGDGFPWDRLDDPRWVGLAGLLLFGLAVGVGLLVNRPFVLFYPLALIGAGLLLARRVRESPLGLVGCGGLAFGGVLEVVAVLGLAETALAAEVVALVGFLVFLVGRYGSA